MSHVLAHIRTVTVTLTVPEAHRILEASDAYEARSVPDLEVLLSGTEKIRDALRRQGIINYRLNGGPDG